MEDSKLVVVSAVVMVVAESSEDAMTVIVVMAEEAIVTIIVVVVTSMIETADIAIAMLDTDPIVEETIIMKIDAAVVDSRAVDSEIALVSPMFRSLSLKNPRSRSM